MIKKIKANVIYVD